MKKYGREKEEEERKNTSENNGIPSSVWRTQHGRTNFSNATTLRDLPLDDEVITTVEIHEAPKTYETREASKSENSEKLKLVYEDYLLLYLVLKKCLQF